MAFDLGVSGVAWRAVAEWHVVDDVTQGVDSAVARVDALGVEAGLVVGTLGVGLASHNRFGCERKRNFF